jgi:hypothetical protein
MDDKAFGGLKIYLQTAGAPVLEQTAKKGLTPNMVVNYTLSFGKIQGV